MSLWVDTLRILLKDVLRSSGPESEVRIQVCDKDGFWIGAVTESHSDSVSASALRVVERHRRDQSR